MGEGSGSLHGDANSVWPAPTPAPMLTLGKSCSSGLQSSHEIGWLGWMTTPSRVSDPSAPGQPEEQALFLPSSAVRCARKQPRRPNFLLEPLQSQRPLEGGSLGRQG